MTSNNKTILSGYLDNDFIWIAVALTLVAIFTIVFFARCRSTSSKDNNDAKDKDSDGAVRSAGKISGFLSSGHSGASGGGGGGTATGKQSSWRLSKLLHH